MNRTFQTRPYAWWSTPTQRAHRTQAEAPIAAPQRRPFAKPNSCPEIGAESALPTAQIFPFTGSNTPYQSHE